ELVYEERDPALYVDIAPTKSRRFIAIELDATTFSETRLVDADNPASQPRVFLPRREDHVYELEHVGTRFVMRTNDGAENFRIVEVPAKRPTDRTGWKELVPHREHALVEGFVAYDRFLAANVRTGGLSRIELIVGSGAPEVLGADEPSFAMTLLDTPDASATRVRYAYDSLTTPTTIYERDVTTGARTLLHREPVPTYDPSRYTTSYLHATATDGAKIPISIVYRTDT